MGEAGREAVITVPYNADSGSGMDLVSDSRNKALEEAVMSDPRCDFELPIRQ